MAEYLSNHQYKECRMSKIITRSNKLFRKRSYFGLVLASLFVCIFYLLHNTGISSAATGCAALPTTNGTTTLSVSVPSTGTYHVWSRIKAPDTTNNSFYFQTDNNCAITIGDSASIPVNTWTWVDYKDGSTTTEADISLSAGTHPIELAGKEAGVQVDRVLLISDTCVPTGTGDNCVAVADTTPPDTTVTSSPNSTTTSTSASFGFSSSETGSTFECKLDSGTYVSCVSPKSYSSLAVGSHAFSVRAIDSSGNIDASPASFTWSIGSTPTQTSNCMPNPSTCGYPDASNTGVTPGTQLTPVSGTVTLSTPGQLYENKIVTGQIVVTGPNITIRNVKLITTNPYYGIKSFTDGSEASNVKNLVLDHVEINLNGNNNTKGIAFDEYTLDHVFIHNGADCAHMGKNVTIKDSFCSLGPDVNNDGVPDNTSWCSDQSLHRDGFQSDGGSNFVIQHNTIRNNCGETSAILMSTNTAPISNVTIDNNLVAGGGWTIYCGTDSGGVASNETFTNNRFAKTYFASGGGYGPSAGCASVMANTNNVWDDTGALIDGSSGTPTPKTGDLNADSQVNIFDLSILLSNYGKTKAQASNPACDLNNDSTINIFDLSILLSNYGK
jgi:hypothetical protein